MYKEDIKVVKFYIKLYNLQEHITAEYKEVLSNTVL